MFKVKIILTNGKTYDKTMDDNEFDKFTEIIYTHGNIKIELKDGSKLCIPDEIIDRIELE